MATKRVVRMVAVPKSREPARKPAAPRRQARPSAIGRARNAAQAAASALRGGPVSSRATPPRMAPNQVGRPTGFVNRRAASTPVGAYDMPQSLDSIPGGYAAGTVPASGALTLVVGPAGVGSVWYPAMAAISTTTGVLDTSTCAVYISPLTDANALVPSTQIGGQSFSGGGSQIPLPGIAVYPGYFVVAVWSGAKSGDQATLTVYGSSKAMV